MSRARSTPGAVAVAMAAVAAVLPLAGGCGGSSSATLEVSAAASLRKALTRYGHQFTAAHARYSFAGSDMLAAQIRQGLRPDVFASANAQLPDALYAEGLVERPVAFAANQLVIAVPRGSHVRNLADLARPGVSIALGSASVPVGAYSQKVLARLPAAERRALLANVVDREPDVTGIVGKLTQGAVDAGLLYVTDVAAARGQLRAIALPPALRPRVLYEIAIVRGSSHRSQARAFLAGLQAGPGRADLLGDGFLAPAGK